MCGYLSFIQAFTFINFVILSEFFNVVKADSASKHYRNFKLTDSRPRFPQSRKLQSGSANSEDSSTSGKTTTCDIIPEIVFAIDVSHSHDDDFKHVFKMLPNLFNYFKDTYLNNVRFSIVTFTDKPIAPFGHALDFCAKVEYPLTLLSSDDAVSRAQAVLTKIVKEDIDGGADYTEGANEVIYRIAASNQVGWTEGDVDPVTNLPIPRFIVVLTDAPVHSPGSSVTASFERYERRSPESQSALDEDINHKCADSDYPSRDDLREVLQKRGITPIILAGVNHYVSAGGEKVLWKQFSRLIKANEGVSTTWSDLDTGLARYYDHYMKTEVGLQNAIVATAGKTSSEFVAVFGAALDAAREMLCPPPPRPPPQKPTEEPTAEPTEAPTVIPEVVPTEPAPLPTSPPAEVLPQLNKFEGNQVAAVIAGINIPKAQGNSFAFAGLAGGLLGAGCACVVGAILLAKNGSTVLSVLGFSRGCDAQNRENEFPERCDKSHVDRDFVGGDDDEAYAF